MTNRETIAAARVLAEGNTVDRPARIEQLQKELAKVNKDIEEQVRLEKRWQLFQTAFGKLRREIGKTLTPEEKQAVDGIYIFYHGGCVDFVRNIPSATSAGEDKKLLGDLDMAEAMHELDSLLQ